MMKVVKNCYMKVVLTNGTIFNILQPNILLAVAMFGFLGRAMHQDDEELP